MKANVGMMYAVASLVDAYTPYSGITYGTGFVVSEARGANVTWETEDGEFRGDDVVLDSMVEKGAYLREQIEALNLPCLGATRGMGLMIGIEVKGGKTNKELAAKLIENGLLCLTAGPGLRLLPPLTITKEEMDKGVAIMKATLAE